MDDHFDLIIVGGGAGAFAAAIKANEYQAKTLMINAGLPLGGTCVNVGCVPSKYLLKVGEFAYRAQHHGFGSIHIPQVEIDFGQAIDDELQTVGELRRAKYTDVLANLEHVTLLEARARFVSPHEIEADGRRYYGDRFVLAVGSTALPPPIPGIEDVGYITHIEALRKKQQPRHLLVIGGGPVALEFSQMFRHLGSEVTMVARGDRLYKRTEPEISEALERYLRDEGVTIHKQATVVRLRRERDRKIATIAADGQQAEIEFDELLIGTGKTANTAGLGLDAAGVALTEQQAVRVNPWYQTNAPHIYAVGDAIDFPKRLETTAGKEGSFATVNALTGVNKQKVNYDLVPSVVFTYPAVADVGILDEETSARGLECDCRTVYFDKVPKALIIKDTRGAIKMVAEQRTGRIVGVHLIAPEGEDLISQAMYILRGHMTVDDVIDSFAVFPTLSEAIKYAALSFRTDIERLSCCI
ncbi:MAG: mercury(II) reductase [Chloroflexi bacterium]|nr:mercury(II) reductase [Chloroflexota bacterium]